MSEISDQARFIVATVSTNGTDLVFVNETTLAYRDVRDAWAVARELNVVRSRWADDTEYRVFKIMQESEVKEPGGGHG